MERENQKNDNAAGGSAAGGAELKGEKIDVLYVIKNWD